MSLQKRILNAILAWGDASKCAGKIKKGENERHPKKL